MDLKTVEALLALFDASTATRLSIMDGDFSFDAEKAQPELSSSREPVPQGVTSEAQEPAITEEASLPAVKAPLVGTVYLAPAPGEDPFVNVGQRVQQGDTLCIIEAMKVMNEIPAPFSCTIREIVSPDGAVVGFDDVLMYVER